MTDQEQAEDVSGPTGPSKVEAKPNPSIKSWGLGLPLGLAFGAGFGAANAAKNSGTKKLAMTL